MPKPPPSFITVGTISRDDVLKFMFGADDARPVWATRGERRKQWNSLNDGERRIAILLLYGYAFSQLAAALHKDARETEKLFISCLEKLGDTTPDALRTLHAQAGFQSLGKGRGRSATDKRKARDT